MAATEIGIPVPAYEDVRPLIGMGADKVLPRVFGCEEGSELGKQIVERKGAIFRGPLAPSLTPTRGAKALLERLHSDGFKLVVATSGSRRDVEMLLDKVGVRHLIDDYTSASDVKNSKPEPDVVFAALELAGGSPAEAIMIGDTPYDVEAATGAGVPVVGVLTGGWLADQLDGAIAVYADPGEILQDYPNTPFA
jgi:HAD superfamily hydrolase (TIGR01509 family)